MVAANVISKSSLTPIRFFFRLSRDLGHRLRASPVRCSNCIPLLSADYSQQIPTCTCLRLQWFRRNIPNSYPVPDCADPAAAGGGLYSLSLRYLHAPVQLRQEHVQLPVLAARVAEPVDSLALCGAFKAMLLLCQTLRFHAGLQNFVQRDRPRR